MLPLDDPQWSELNGGYKIPYDASGVLKRLEQGEDAWEELSSELQNQGDVGEASYAALPHLVRIGKALPQRDARFYGLVSTIEIERHRDSNPPLPEWMAEDYQAALRELLEVACGDLVKATDPAEVRSILGALAVAKGELKLGALVSRGNDAEINQFLEQFDAWADVLRRAGDAPE